MHRRLGLLAGLFLAGLALRPQIVGVGPLIPRIQDDLGVSHAVAGLLGTIPVLCMGIFALPAPEVSRRYGTRLAIAVCLGLIGAFGIARGLAPGAAAVILLTFGVGVGLGLAQALMPAAVKERFALRPAFATGIYVLGLQHRLGALVGPRGPDRRRDGKLALVARGLLGGDGRARSCLDVADARGAAARTL